MLQRIREHVSEKDDLHLWEQIDRTTGQQYNAKDSHCHAKEIYCKLRDSKDLKGFERISKRFPLKTCGLGPHVELC